MQNLLQEIIHFADKAHGDQMRRYTTDRYIVHPVRVMKMCMAYTHDITILSAAILHDVLEDTTVTKEEIRNFLVKMMTVEEADRTLSIVQELTDVYIKGDYPQWNRRKRKNKEADRLEKTSAAAQTIKYADIIDNAPEITRMDPDFAKRYLQEYNFLLKKIDKGHPVLYQQAVETIHECIAALKLQT
jgi:guanosine-3',5'-bis(diphosphate) 3'-pyrophosphohydrolase